MTNTLSPIDERLCFALYSTSQAIIKKYKKSLAKLNMTYPQYLAYLVLSEQDTMIVKDLGKALYLDSATLTPLLKRMEQSGLVTRQRASDDERKVMISLTPKAKTLHDDIATIQKDVACSTGLAPERFQALLTQLHDLNQQLRSPQAESSTNH
jgi:DNA-binding MarR family transcriptional regulator